MKHPTTTNVSRKSNGRTKIKASNGAVTHSTCIRILLAAIYGGLCFYVGMVAGMHIRSSHTGGGHCTTQERRSLQTNPNFGNWDDSRPDLVGWSKGCNESQIESMVKERIGEELKSKTKSSDTTERRRISDSMRGFATGVMRTNKKSFMKTYDLGVRQDSIGPGQRDVLILYNSMEALPADHNLAHAAIYDDGKGIPYANPDVATANCKSLNVITTRSVGGVRQCIAVVSNYENFHIHKWMRVPEDGGHLDANLPLRSVASGQTLKGNSFHPPYYSSIKSNWDLLRTFLNNVDEVFDELRPIAERVAKDNTIVVMSCDKEHLELLVNFVCSSKSKGLELGNVLVFASDEETKGTAEGLGLATFWYDKHRASRPSGEARSPSDSKFIAMMYAKVVCVQMVNMLGYDLLFQDVGVVWYMNPLEFFHNKSNPIHEFDMIFQDDGAHAVRAPPFSASLGFYFVRRNDRTRYFLTSLLHAGDRMTRSSSYQQAFMSVLNEQASLYGLRVKIIDREQEEFPCEWHFHQKKVFMQKFIRGGTNSYIFHINWTPETATKREYFEQMGDWYKRETCLGVGINETTVEQEPANGSSLMLAEKCCSSEPLISCHYTDKPSKVPCRDSPPKDPSGKPFW